MKHSLSRLNPVTSHRKHSLKNFGSTIGKGNAVEVISNLLGDDFGRKFLDQAGRDVGGILSEGDDGAEDGIDGASEGIGIVGRNDDPALVRLHERSSADAIGGDDGAAEDER